jgi:hypothetical protein
MARLSLNQKIAKAARAHLRAIDDIRAHADKEWKRVRFPSDGPIALTPDARDLRLRLEGDAQKAEGDLRALLMEAGML